jgi:hypothetical protein
MKGITSAWLMESLRHDPYMETEIRRLDRSGYVVIVGREFHPEVGDDVIVVRGHPVDDPRATVTINKLEVRHFLRKETVLDFYRVVLNQLKLL